jgi:TPR repeat protein
VTQNIENAGQLYSLAANQGHGPATLALARLIRDGIGTKPDPLKAWALATLADERGEKEARKMITEISSTLDDKQMAAAKKELDNLKSGKSGDAAPAPAAPAKQD